MAEVVPLPALPQSAGPVSRGGGSGREGGSLCLSLQEVMARQMVRGQTRDRCGLFLRLSEIPFAP
jgi:hypothetical protein